MRPAAASSAPRAVRCQDTAWPCARSPAVSAEPIVSSSSTTSRSATAETVGQRRSPGRDCLPSAYLRLAGGGAAGSSIGQRHSIEEHRSRDHVA